ncbi:MAG: thermonuclease family protein [Candidatus Omnitrophica bacterium]|nr:thermonuclease family protein [Candidatus Omnitrophota bacterium]
MKLKNMYLLGAVVIVTSLIASSCVGKDSDVARENGYFVRRVIDGDTIQLQNGQFVRYIGIDSPETRKRARGGWIYSPEPYSLDAKKLNSELVGRGQVELEFDEEKYDKYGRWLAYVYADNKMVNEEILRAGRARILIIPPNTKYLRRLKIAEIEAKENNRGIWKK